MLTWGHARPSGMALGNDVPPLVQGHPTLPGGASGSASRVGGRCMSLLVSGRRGEASSFPDEFFSHAFTHENRNDKRLFSRLLRHSGERNAISPESPILTPGLLAS